MIIFESRYIEGRSLFMQGLILAAGMGKRLKELTAGNTKCMVKVNGVTLIERVLRILDKKDLSKIVIVVGYRGKQLMDYISTLNIKTPIVYVNNEIYDKTNNIYSLALAGEYLCAEDTLLFESDLIFEEAVVDALLEDPRETLALVDKFESWMDGTCTVLDDEDCIVDFVPGKYLKFMEREQYYKTVNIYKFSKHFSKNTYMPFLDAYAKAMGNNEYYESVIKLIAMLETKEIRVKRLEGQKWYEIDDVQDLDIAESMFAETAADRYDAINSRYGGYWRYPKLLDYCYLVNPYFPPQKMSDEIKSNFETLMSQYPSGMRVNSLLAAKNFGLRQEHVVIGNGAAELIKSLMQSNRFEKVGFIRPTFEEYPNRFYNEAVIYDVTENGFRYQADDIMAFFDAKDIDALVVINPDNPSGNYMDVDQLKQLINWSKAKNITLIVDESFVDFVSTHEDECWEEYSLLTEEILASYEELYVVKSISKSYGVPGFRLGILASANEKLIAEMKKDVAIWNINSFGEFFMQIFEKYKKDYALSLKKIKHARAVFEEELSHISKIKVLPSQANYVMCELDDSITSRELAVALLERNVFIKDLSSKVGNGKQYIRLAVRSEEENQYLVAQLKELL